MGVRPAAAAVGGAAVGAVAARRDPGRRAHLDPLPRRALHPPGLVATDVARAARRRGGRARGRPLAVPLAPARARGGAAGLYAPSASAEPRVGRRSEAAPEEATDAADPRRAVRLPHQPGGERDDHREDDRRALRGRPPRTCATTPGSSSRATTRRTGASAASPGRSARCRRGRPEQRDVRILTVVGSFTPTSPSSAPVSPASWRRPSCRAPGRDVVVLEARDRVGGRVLNTEIGGEPNELGGQWIAPYQAAMHALLAELGHRALPRLPRGRPRLHRRRRHARTATTATRRRSGRRPRAPTTRPSRSSTRSRPSSTRRRRGSTRALPSSTRSASSTGSRPRSTTRSRATCCGRSWPAAT